MMDIFEQKAIKPMLIGKTSEAFDDSDFIYELKLDGERCIAYLDPMDKTELRNKRNMMMLPKVPELSEIHAQVKERCILDGELIIMVDGKPNFFEIQKRSLTNNNFKIHLQATRFPASFIAFDILYLKDHEVISLPLLERKKLLDGIVLENECLSVSRYIEQQGINFYHLVEHQGLEGIVAKIKTSKYYFDKRTTEWIKIKNLQDDDFVVCGYLKKENNVFSLILGQYKDDELIYKGNVILGATSDAFRQISKMAHLSEAPFIDFPELNEDVAWLKPELVCTVKYMMKTSGGSMRQPVFKGLREDKVPHECKTL